MIAYPEMLKELLGVKVDVVSRRGIKPRIRERALQEAIPYERPTGAVEGHFGRHRESRELRGLRARGF
jgi:hypothetical protein